MPTSQNPELKLNLLAALVAAKKEFDPVLKEKKNTFFNSRYADLNIVLASVEPALLKHGLVLVQTIDAGDSQQEKVLVETGEGKSKTPIPFTATTTTKTCATLITRLFHAPSGEFLESTYPIADMSDPQKFGSAVTYARRYAVKAMLSLADEDDDGNAASGRGGVSESRQTSMAALAAIKEAGVTSDQIKAIAVAETSKASPKDMTDAELVSVVKACELKFNLGSTPIGLGPTP